MPEASDEITRLKASMAALEGQRPVLGDSVVEPALAALREKLAALQAQTAQSVQQRKLVTILFADISGFTALSEKLDAEVMAGIMNDLWSMVDAAVTEHGGRIDKHIGDAVMALWGAETAREDDPERAVRGALAMQGAVKAFCESHSAPLAMRIGINTGPVVLGQVGSMREFTAMGDAVNLASRLEHAAPVGGVLIGHDTYRHVRGIFDVLPQAPLAVKGKAELVQTYVVQQTKPRAFRMATRGVEGIETRMVGRDAELDTLKNAYLNVIDSAETRVVTIVGEAGVGKSRLLYEFDNWIELRPEKVYYFKGRSTPNTQNVPYSLFRDLFANRFHILESDPSAVALDKFRRGMAGILDPNLADVVGHWLGFDFSSSEAVRNLLGDSGLMGTARAYLVRYFRALSVPLPGNRGGRASADAEALAPNSSHGEENQDQRPMVIFLEDIHWADDPSLDLAVHLANMLSTARLLVVCAARPIFLERRPNWGEGEAAFTRIVLKPLSKRSSRILVDEILQRVVDIPDSLRDLIVETAEGNPYYVEEVVKMLIEQGMIERGPVGAGPAYEIWRVRADKLVDIKVPPTLTGLLQARLDGLPRPEREALQRASIIGRLFWDNCVADLLATDRTAVSNTLAAVRERELIFRREQSSFVDASEYIFKHALLRDVVYETVLLKYRAELHGRVARWLEDHAGDRRGEYLSLIAEHYIQAGEQQLAARYLEQTGDQMLAIGIMPAARHAYERALSLSSASARAAIAVKLGETIAEMGEYEAAAQILESVPDDAEPGIRATVNLWLGWVSLERGDYERSLSLYLQAVALAQPEGGRLLARALVGLSNVMLVALEDFVNAENHAREGLALARESGDLVLEMRALIMLGRIASFRGDSGSAQTYHEEVITLARHSGNREREATALNNLSLIHVRQGNLTTALALAQTALDMKRESGALPHIANILSTKGEIYLALDQPGEARTSLRASLKLSRQLGYVPSILYSLVLFAKLAARDGHVLTALNWLGLIQNHPACGTETRLALLETLSHMELGTIDAETGLAAGAALDLNTVVQEIVDGKW